MDGEVFVVAVVKGTEHFVFIFNDRSKTELLRTLGRMAADLSIPAFTWYDASILSEKVRQLIHDSKSKCGGSDQNPSRLGSADWG